MEKRSEHYGDVEKWVEKVIESCETYEQTFTAKRLIVNFGRQMSRNNHLYTLIWGIRYSLDNKLAIKRNELKNSL